jgi:hypothetical protein
MFRTIVVGLLAVMLLAGCSTSRYLTKVEREAQAPPSPVGATIANIWYVPGRAISCFGGALIAGVLITTSFGGDHEGSSEVLHGACGPPWILKAEDVR